MASIEPQGPESSESATVEQMGDESDGVKADESNGELRQILNELMMRFRKEDSKSKDSQAGSIENKKSCNWCICRQPPPKKADQQDEHSTTAKKTPNLSKYLCCLSDGGDTNEDRPEMGRGEDNSPFCCLRKNNNKVANDTGEVKKADQAQKDKETDHSDNILLQFFRCLYDCSGKDKDGNNDKDENDPFICYLCKNKDKVIDHTSKGGDADNTDEDELNKIKRLLSGWEKAGITRNAMDEFGEKLLHQLARCWHKDVALLLIDKPGKDTVTRKDEFGRQPLHVAAYMDNVAMVEFLLEKGADVSAEDKYGRTAITYAAVNDALGALKVLHKKDAEVIHKPDKNGRTPLMVAALGDRSIGCKELLYMGAKADVEDDNGESCIVVMLAKMPTVARIALDQFHTLDGPNRSQEFELYNLEFGKTHKEEDDQMRKKPTAMQVVVRSLRLENIDHRVFRELIEEKWKKFGRRLALLDFASDLIYIILWTALAVIKPDARACYYFPGDTWRVILWIFAVWFTLVLIAQEFIEFSTSKRELNEWKKWKEDIIDKDLKECNGTWPQEKKWLKSELGKIDERKSHYLHDYWNIFDWIVYGLLMFCVVLHLIDIGIVPDELCWPERRNDTTGNTTTEPVKVDDDDIESIASRIHIRVFAITIIFVWIRILKSARAFMWLGPFIAMCYKILYDVARFIFLYIVFYIPYTSAFWMMFGGDVEEFETVSETLFSLFRMTLVDEYNYEGLKEENPVMCDILVGTYLAISAIVLLNLFIAMLSETFIRIHGNTESVALMERAKIILNLECYRFDESKRKFRSYMQENCNPLKKDYDDDETIEYEEEDIKKVSLQIKDKLTRHTREMKGMQDKIQHILDILEKRFPANPEDSVSKTDPKSVQEETVTMSGTETAGKEKRIRENNLKQTKAAAGKESTENTSSKN